MFTAPLVDRVGSQDPPGAKPAPAPDDPAKYAASRLARTMWDRAPALAVYRSMLRLGSWLAGHRVSADALTFFSVVLAAASAVAAALGHFVLAGSFILLSGAADALDGAVARAARTTSRFG